MKGHENKKKYTPFQSQIMGIKWWEIKCMPCVVARIYIVGSLVVLEKGVRVRRNCNIFNLAMENVLKGLPDKISCPDIIHKCTSNVHIFLITFKLRDRGDEIGFLFFNVWHQLTKFSETGWPRSGCTFIHVSFLSEADDVIHHCKHETIISCSTRFWY